MPALRNLWECRCPVGSFYDLAVGDGGAPMRPTPIPLCDKIFGFVAFPPNPTPPQPAPVLDLHSGPFIANDSLVTTTRSHST